MTLECPKCKSPVARAGQRFCYRCGQELNAYYESLKLKVPSSEPGAGVSHDDVGTSRGPQIPTGTVILEPHAFDAKEQEPPVEPQNASLKILLPTGDVFDREIKEEEIQIGKGPRNDLVMADAAVSAAHAIIRRDGEKFTITDIGSRNGTSVNGERIFSARQLNHGDVIGMGLSKLTFRFTDYTETASFELDKLAPAEKRTVPPLTQASLALAVVSAGLVSKADVDRVNANGTERRLASSLIDERLVAEESLRDLMSSTFEIPSIDLDKTHLDEALISEFPPGLAYDHQVFPITKERDGLVLAVADPTDTKAVEEITGKIHSPVQIRLATLTQIRRQLDRYYGPRLIGLLPSGEKLEHPIDQPEVSIGKAAHNHVVLNDPTVSNTHAILIAREGGYSVVDLGSRNGTFVNSERLGSQAHMLRHGDKILVGKTVLTFRNPGETAANTTTVLSAEALAEVKRRAALTDVERQRGPNPAEAADERPSEIPALAQATAGSASAAKVVDATSANSEAASPVEGVDGITNDENKKTKKKKKKDKDARLRAAYVSAGGRIFAAVLSVALTVALTTYLIRQGQDKGAIKVSTKGHAKLKADKLSSATPFKEGALGTSGVVQVPGADTVLMVDDSKLDVILAMGVDSSGQQAGPIKSIPLGASIADMEGIAYGDGYFYVTGSQGDPKGGDQNAIARFKFDPATQTIQGTEVIPNLRQFLLENVPELKGQGDKKGKEGGLNIEGLAWDPRAEDKRLLLGLRSPQLNGKAMIVAIKLTNPSGPFSMDNLRLAEPRAIQLELEGLGIRDIQYDIRLQAFLVIAGAPEHGETKLGFKLWEWSGETSPSDSKLLKKSDLDTAMHPEGVTHLVVGGREFIFIVGDGGGYTKLDYTEED
jgi:pSer/pThr/pTyr-binding forkhead associated (FHA) protein